MIHVKVTLLVIAALGASASRATPRQTPESPPASTPPVAATNGASQEAEETAALIAKANAAAAANARAASMATPTATKIEASPAGKKARDFGFRAEIYNGDTLFCKQDAALGSRIPLTRCMSAQEFEDYATQLKLARDTLQNKLQCTGGKYAMLNICGQSP